MKEGNGVVNSSLAVSRRSNIKLNHGGCTICEKYNCWGVRGMNKPHIKHRDVRVIPSSSEVPNVRVLKTKKPYIPIQSSSSAASPSSPPSSSAYIPASRARSAPAVSVSAAAFTPGKRTRSAPAVKALKKCSRSAALPATTRPTPTPPSVCFLFLLWLLCLLTLVLPYLVIVSYRRLFY